VRRTSGIAGLQSLQNNGFCKSEALLHGTDVKIKFTQILSPEPLHTTRLQYKCTNN